MGFWQVLHQGMPATYTGSSADCAEELLVVPHEGADTQVDLMAVCVAIFRWNEAQRGTYASGCSFVVLHLFG
jgi:hypothetical protein